MANPERSLARIETPFGWLERGPFAELFGGSLRMPRFFDEAFGERGIAGIPAMPLDVTEADGHYVVTAEVPGVDKKDLTVECKDGALTIRGEKRSQREETKEKARLLERTYGAFSRTLVLPQDADADQVNAAFRDGVLRIDIQKKPAAKPRTVAIKS
jgi:HSP20 family protein